MKQQWTKLGVIHTVDGKASWNRTHAQCPTALPIGDDVLRVYYGTRDGQNRTRTTFIDVDANDPTRVLYRHDRPILELGRLGTFDESGVMPNWALEHDGKVYFHYLGWNVGATVRYRVALGLAVSEDGGTTFERVSEGPVMDRSMIDPIGVSTNCVLIDQGVWKSWYMSYTGWEVHDSLTEPLYHIRYAESPDGVHWTPSGKVCIDYADGNEGGIARPSVLKTHGGYRMWYSTRMRSGYREDEARSYRMGYAESNDGLDWTRMDERAGLTTSGDGWDSMMVAYPNVCAHGGRLIMFYNGNGFGASGIGCAQLVE